MLLHDHEKLDGHAAGSFHAGLSLLGGRLADIKVAGKNRMAYPPPGTEGVTR
jgi:hypothetical protein